VPADDHLNAHDEQVWIEQAHDWIRAVLEEQGLHVAGRIVRPRLLPWSTVLEVPTNDGTVYFKSSHRLFSYEPALTQALYEWRPDCMVKVLAVNLEKHWMLMADEGAMLRSLIKSAEDLKYWHRLLPLFAEVQIELSGRQQELLRLGVFDRRLNLLPAKFEGLINDRDMLHLDEQDGLTWEEYLRLQDLIPYFKEMCDKLASYTIPDTLHHEDFHDGNVFITPGRYAFSDWGESSLSHPFFSLVVNLRSTADRLSLPEEVTESPERFTPEISLLRDTYLEPWGKFAPLQTLREIFSLAWRAGMINRALTWYKLMLNSDEPARQKYGHAVSAWLREFLLAVSL
jgi:hypothetical protein